ncbi:MAG: DUF91 domain-containing protein [Candidatus Korarchaeota archaeon]|nr:DUF91 domain-containing protein [Candidatus Korarchaeota archaeon]NIU82548.1 DUF91 domain-containing protein [Candidatus Thorarchaeota archaeon]NIW13036.1 DUF91 domain-containing protein [Candidatus Thorarchaeota archaeon]NIW51211.1 DUF91 domain-containing protein [Candidatus Korarchaeota archaeon]
MGKPYEVHLQPSKKEVVNKVNQEWRRKVILLLFQGSVEYGGRAKSKLKEGRYLLLSKPDGSLLIHGPEKREPINWQPPESSLHAQSRNHHLRVVSIRTTPRERLLVSISHAFVLLLVQLEKGAFTLWESERQMVDSIYSKPELLENGFQPIRREALTPYGKIDLVGLDKEGVHVLCEFKRRKAEMSAVSQLRRYIQYYKEVSKGAKSKVRGFIVAPDVSSSAMRLLRKYNLEFKPFSPSSAEGGKSLEDFLEEKSGQ